MLISIHPTRFLAAAVMLAAILPGTAGASDVSWSITVGNPGAATIYAPPPAVYVQPQPVYVAPRRIYVQPQPVYIQPGAVVHVEAPRFGYGPPQHSRGKHRQWKHRGDHRH